MLNAYPRALTEGLSLSDQTWFDLVDPTEAERSAFEGASGLRVPSKNELGEIEATSRLQIKNDALYMTLPMIFAAENEPWLPTPVGFVLSKQLLMTVRFANLVPFNTVAKETSAAEKPDPTSVFVRLLVSPNSDMAIVNIRPVSCLSSLASASWPCERSPQACGRWRAATRDRAVLQYRPFNDLPAQGALPRGLNPPGVVLPSVKVSPAGRGPPPSHSLGQL